jgi:hypothetical protein
MLSFTPRPLYPRKSTLVSIELLASWAPDPVWSFWRRQKSHAVVRTRTTDRPSRSPVTTDRSVRAAEFVFATPESELMETFGVTYSEEVCVDVTPWTCIREASRFESMSAHELSCRKFCVVLPSSSTSADRASVTSQPLHSRSISINL